MFVFDLPLCFSNVWLYNVYESHIHDRFWSFLITQTDAVIVHQWHNHLTLQSMVSGALMILAWIFCGSIGIIMARYYKPMWVEKKACGQKIWFQIHRGFMLAAMFISLIAFVLILVAKNGVYDPINQLELPRRAHPILGLIAIICSFLNVRATVYRFCQCQVFGYRLPFPICCTEIFSSQNILSIIVQQVISYLWRYM